MAILCTVFDLALPSPAGLIIASVLYFGWGIRVAMREAAAAPLTLNPLVCYQLWYAITLGFATLYTSLRYAADSAVPFGNYTLPLEQVAFGHAILVLGSWAFYAGMKRFQPRQDPQLGAVPRGLSGMALVVAAVVGLAFHVGKETITRYFGSTFAQPSLLLPAALSMVAVIPPVGVKRSVGAQFGILMIGSLFLLLANMRRDSKMEMMFSFVPLVWWVLRRRKRAALAFMLVVLSAFYVVLVAPVAMTVRVTVGRSEAGIVSVLNPSTFRVLIPELHESFVADPGSFVVNWADLTIRRVSDPVAAGMVTTFAHEGGFLLGRELGYVPLAFVPRVLWPEKPYLDRGRQFTALLGWAPDPDSATTSTQETPAGELYWNFGWPGVLLGMYLLGAVLSGLWWRAAGSDPRRGLFEMAAFTGAMLSFVLGTGAAAGGLFVWYVGAGLFWRVIIALRDKWFRVTVRRPRPLVFAHKIP